MSETSNKPVRVRFAPSPTGSLHIGGLRTALFNWLFARHHKGTFILRIEDTDQKRYDPTALETLYDALRWAGLTWDEGPDVGGAHGPYVQSERLPLYQKWAHWLVETGKAYKCFCTPQRLEQVNKEKQARKEAPGYDRHCRYLTPEQVAEREANGEKYVIRLAMPLEGQTAVTDVIRGEVSFDNSTIQDMVLLKSDGFPTYHLANVVDDHFMEISHVMRAVEWLPSLPLHVQLWQAFGWEMPIYAHLPVLLNPNGKGKISKRNPPRDAKGNIIPVMVHDYIQAGYLPEAMVNFLTNIGWSFGDDREVFSVEESIERFDLSRINPANSAYPVEKLDWLNGHYINHIISDEDLTQRLRKVLEDAGYKVNPDVLEQVTPLVKSRMKRLTDVIEIAGFFFAEEFKPPAPQDVIQKKMDAASTRSALETSLKMIETLPDFERETLHMAFEKLGAEIGLNNSQMFGLLRVAVSGQKISTPTFETMEIVGKAESVRRIQLAIEALETLEKTG